MLTTILQWTAVLYWTGTVDCAWMSQTFCPDIPGSQGLAPVASQCWALLWLLSLGGKWGGCEIGALNEAILEPEVCEEITSKWEEKLARWKVVDLSRMAFKRIDLFYLTLWELFNKTQQPQKWSSLFHVQQPGLSKLSPWNKHHYWWNFVAKLAWTILKCQTSRRYLRVGKSQDFLLI